jgi:hypothetical protein
MPKPIPGQSQSDFISICIPQVIADGTADTPEQATAICYSMWEEAKKEINESIQSE